MTKEDDAAPVDGVVMRTLGRGFEVGDGNADGAMIVRCQWLTPMRGCDSLDDVADAIEEQVNEIRSVLALMDQLAEQWGDEAVFRRCRDRLRKIAFA